MPSPEHLYREYPCSRNAPLNCDRPWETAQQVKGAKFCLECGFPATLPLPSEIKGNRGNYQVTGFLGVRGMGRLYSGKQLQDGQSVVIKEYLLPSRCFNPQETLQTKETFKRVAGVSLADGRIQNFRLVNSWEAIADETGERCYLIIQNTETYQTLGQYLRENRAMFSSEVREVLNQALQTLVFLHTQKLRLPANQIQQGLAHGNLSLDSMLIEIKNHQHIYIYLCDLFLWENLFVPPAFAQKTKPEPNQDLVSLGLVAFYLWAGRQTNPTTGQPLNPRDQQSWFATDSHLQLFIRRLIGLGTPFENAETARQELLKLPKPQQDNNLVALDASETQTKHQKRLWIILGVMTLVLIGGGIWYFFWRNSEYVQEKFRPWNELLPSFTDVNGIPPGEFTYTGERDGTWSLILSLRPQSDRTLEELLTKPRPDIEATFDYVPVSSIDFTTVSKPIEAVQTNTKNFAITSVLSGITDEMEKKQVAYDGLLVFVAFSKKDSNLPKALKGQITLEQLHQIYTGKLTNWQQLGGPNLPIKPYVPKEIEAVQQFQKLVLKDDPGDIALFTANVTTMATEKTQQLILKEFDEGRTGIISFGILSKTWNQCSGYPLAVVDDQKPPSQALYRRQSRQPINPLVNLCDKENYLEVDNFKTGNYPLGYPMFVVYPKDNTLPPAGSKFAEILTTREGQCLLYKVGLVPLQSMPDKYLNSNACKSVS
ncbi:substrate-binding domain-containing protein [Pelatocladus sp. BLCC-F211]|uniref:substrate-binding domain-containing protein n=1 Tax=Pelatocladus sp. BLCC-F211 TaxID=3342752 RepID=UPI0035B851D5